jgi:hypothetical protein
MAIKAAYAAISFIIDSHILQFLPAKLALNFATLSAASCFASSSVTAFTLIVFALFKSHPQVLQLIVVLTLRMLIMLTHLFSVAPFASVKL